MCAPPRPASPAAPAPASPPPRLPAPHYRNAAPRAPRLLHPIPFRRVGGASTRCACDSDTAPTDAEQGDDGSGRRSSTISLSEAARLELEAESQRRSSLPTGRRTSGVEVSESLSSSVKMPLAEETDEQLAHATADDGAGVDGGRPDDLSHLAAIAGAGPHESITLTIEAPAPI